LVKKKKKRRKTYLAYRFFWEKQKKIKKRKKKKKKKKVGELTWHIVFFWKKRENISMSLTVLYMGQKYWSKQGQNSKKIVTDLFALT